MFEGGMATCFAYGQTGSGKTHVSGLQICMPFIQTRSDSDKEHTHNEVTSKCEIRQWK